MTQTKNLIFEQMGQSPTIQSLVRFLDKIAPTPLSVLIEGESGSGKELVARAIHKMSQVASGPFVAIDCGAIPETLFESELFGYKKGAFTGASADKTGFFEAAHGGTLFLDEICNLSWLAQQKLLRALEEREVQKIGSVQSRPVCVRVIAATNRALMGESEKESFRRDLLYRLQEITVRLAPLRERKEDISYLAARFLKESRAQFVMSAECFSQEAQAVLTSHPWQGNARELRNVVRQAAFACDGREIQKAHFSFFADQAGGRIPSPYRPSLFNLGSDSLTDMVQKYTQAFEEEIIKEALHFSGGNKARVAKLLKIDYKTLYRKLKVFKGQEDFAA